jgi:hypothetical protein
MDLKEAWMQQANDSSTKVNYPQNVLSGVRKTFGFKCDTGLAEAFKPVAKRYFGSVCRPLECFMLAVLGLQKEQVNFGQTVRIENLHIERNLRSRRKLVVEEEVVEIVSEPCCDFCSRRPIVTMFRHVKSGICKRACSYHANALRNRTDWAESSNHMGELGCNHPSGRRG